MDKELLDYVATSLESGHSKASIKAVLKKHGWPESRINSAFKELGHLDVPSAPDYGAPGRAPNAPAPSKTRGGPGTGYHQRFFKLQEREKIVYETKPMKGLLWHMIISSIIGLAIFLLFFGVWIFMAFMATLFSGLTNLLYIISLPLALIILVVIITIVLAKRRYDMMYYWITDQRIVIKKGLIGYSVNSIPLERISDALISRSFLERIFGFGSLHIQSLAGQYSVGRHGAEANLRAIPNPEENQALISKLIKERRKEAKLTI